MTCHSTFHYFRGKFHYLMDQKYCFLRTLATSIRYKTLFLITMCTSNGLRTLTCSKIWNNYLTIIGEPPSLARGSEHLKNEAFMTVWDYQSHNTTVSCSEGVIPILYEGTCHINTIDEFLNLIGSRYLRISKLEFNAVIPSWQKQLLLPYCVWLYLLPEILFYEECAIM